MLFEEFILKRERQEMAEIRGGSKRRAFRNHHQRFFMLGEETIDLIGDSRVEKVVGLLGT